MRKLLGLESFGMGPGELRRLAGWIGVRVNLRAFDITSAVSRLNPEDRHPFLRRQSGRWVARLRAAFPAAGWKVVGEARGIPYALAGRIPAGQAAVVARLSGVEAVVVTHVSGRRRRPLLAAPISWYCVRGMVAIQIEGQRTGMQTVEDRFLLARADSAEDAVRRLAPRWRAYARPYLNSSGQLVRWQLEKITDVYEVVADHELDGAEIYSRLARRRLRANLVWRGERRSRPPRS